MVLQDGSHKILDSCTYPLTGKHCIDRIITDLVSVWAAVCESCMCEVMCEGGICEVGCVRMNV